MYFMVYWQYDVGVKKYFDSHENIRMEDFMKTIGLIGAMEEEVASLKKQMTETTETSKAGMIFTEGNLWGTKTVVVVSGIGKVNMAICTQILVDEYNISALIKTGVAGSLNNDYDIGDIVLSECAQQHDMDVSALGDPVGIIPRMERSVFYADKTLLFLAEKACKKGNPDIQCHVGKIVSGDQFISSAEKKDYLIATFEGDCAEMEGAAMAQAAYLNQIPFLIIRAISDKADNSSHMDYPEFEKQAIVHTIKLLEEMYKNL